MILILF